MIWMFLPGCSFSRRSSASTSVPTIVVLSHGASRSVVETTTLGNAVSSFARTGSTSSASALDQNSAKES
jgi:hypothetical protein